MKALELALLGLLMGRRRRRWLLLMSQTPVDFQVVVFLAQVSKLAMFGPFAISFKVVLTNGPCATNFGGKVRCTAFLDSLVSDVRWQIARPLKLLLFLRGGMEEQTRLASITLLFILVIVAKPVEGFLTTVTICSDFCREVLKTDKLTSQYLAWKRSLSWLRY